MRAKTRSLVGGRAVLVKIVEARLADADHPRVVRILQKRIRAFRPFLIRTVRMHADRAPDIRMSFGDREHVRKAREFGADRLHHLDPGLLRARKHAFPVLGKFRKIEMTVAVD